MLEARPAGRATLLAMTLLLSACVALPPSPAPPTATPSTSPERPTDPTATPAPAATATPPPEPTPEPTPTIDPTSAFLGMDYACDDGPAFQPVMLTRPAIAETEDHPSASALRALIASPETQGDGLPLVGWRLLERTATSADYLAPSTGGAFVNVALAVRDGAWVPEGYGPCLAGLRRANLAATNLSSDPAFPRPDASTRRLHLLVMEVGCSSGKRIGDRLRPPIVETSADQVRIAFGVVPLPGAQDCQGVRPTPVVVDLGEPLRDRQVVNASVLPFQPLGEEF